MIATIDADLAAFLADEVTAPVAAPAPVMVAAQPDTSNPLAFLDGVTEEKPKGKRKTYPEFPDTDGIASALAKRTLELSGAADQLKANNKLLGEMFLPEWFRYNHKRGDSESGMKISTDQGPVLAVATSKLLKMTTEKPLNAVRAIFGGAEKSMFFWTYNLKVDPDEIPTANHPAFVTELRALISKHGGTKDALEVDKEFKPRPSFFSERHLMFTPEQNMEINRAMPQVTSIKTKGVQ